MKYVASCSFGKDSLAMIIKLMELKKPIDEVIYCDIRFDDNISGETPPMYEFIKKAEKILFDRYGLKVTHLKGITFKEQFYKIKQKGKHTGNNYGFPYVVGAWCNARLKMQPIKKYFSNNKDVIQYVGIAYDEPKRYERLDHTKIIAPLYDLKITEKEAMEICRQNDLLSPIYETSFRGGCWFCPKQSLKQLEWLWREYPELWQELKEMQKHSFNTFKPGLTIDQIEQKFISKHKQLSLI